MREVIYGDLLPVRRKLLHRHVAEAIEPLHADDLAPRVAALGQRREREVSFCGDQESDAAPDRLDTAGNAEQAVGDARIVVDLCERHGLA